MAIFFPSVSFLSSFLLEKTNVSGKSYRGTIRVSWSIFIERVDALGDRSILIRFYTEQLRVGEA